MQAALHRQIVGTSLILVFIVSVLLTTETYTYSVTMYAVFFETYIRVVYAIKAKFHYASWFGAGSEPFRSWFELKFDLSSSLLAAN